MTPDLRQRVEALKRYDWYSECMFSEPDGDFVKLADVLALLDGAEGRGPVTEEWLREVFCVHDGADKGLIEGQYGRLSFFKFDFCFCVWLNGEVLSRSDAQSPITKGDFLAILAAIKPSMPIHTTPRGEAT